METTRKYGTPSWATLDEEGMNQLYLGHQLRNELVAYQKRFDSVREALWALIPDVADKQSEVDSFIDAVRNAEINIRDHKIEDESSAVRPEDDEGLKLAKVSLNNARSELKKLKRHNKKLYEDLPEYEFVKAAKEWIPPRSTLYHHIYAEWTANKGLGWGTFNYRFRERHRAEVDQVIKRRLRGEAADLQFHKWRGEGTIVIQQQLKAPPVFELIDNGANPKHKLLRIKIGRARGLGAHVLEIPIVYHRPLPSDGKVKSIKITRKRVADRTRLSVSFNITMPNPTSNDLSKHKHSLVGLRIGWKRVRNELDSGISVATLSVSSNPLPYPPEDIKQYLHTNTDGTIELIYPSSLMRILGKDDDIRSYRDLLAFGKNNEQQIHAMIIDALKEDSSLEEKIGFSLRSVVQTRSLRNLSMISERWPGDHPLKETLNSWKRRDIHLWRYESFEREQTVARRRDIYRKFSHYVVANSKIVAMSSLDIASIKEISTVEDNPRMSKVSRKSIQTASPGELQKFITEAATKFGTEVMLVGEE